MFNVGLPEILVISVITLLVFGPKRLPELAKGMGKGIRDCKKALEGSGEDKSKNLPKESKTDNTIDVTHQGSSVDTSTPDGEPTKA